MSISNTDRWARAEDIPEPRIDRQSASFYCEHPAATENALVILPGNGVSIKDCARATFQKLAARRTMYCRGGVVVEVKLRTGEAPTMLGAGYHASLGGVLVSAGDEPDCVEELEAVEALNSLLAEFEFQSEGDRSRALAQLITLALKAGGWITGFVPVDVAEADQSQSGKTFRQRLTAVLYNELPRVISKRAGGVGSVDESFAQALVAGSMFIQLDNFRGKLDSQYIEAFLTAVGRFAARIPHRGDVMVDPTRFFLQLTSNGVETSRDMANRSCIVRIRKRVGHTFRQYDEGDLMAHVHARQSY